MSVPIARATATQSADGQRRCAFCGDFIDPIDWCLHCQATGIPCLRPHKRLRLRTDAAFCDAACRVAHRSTFIRDCT